MKRPRPRLNAPLVSITGQGEHREDIDWHKCLCPPFGKINSDCPIHNPQSKGGGVIESPGPPAK